MHFLNYKFSCFMTNYLISRKGSKGIPLIFSWKRSKLFSLLFSHWCFFSSPEPKTQVSIFVHCLLFFYHCFILLTFSSSQNYKTTFGNFSHMKDHVLFQGEIIAEKWNHKANFNQTRNEASCELISMGNSRTENSQLFTLFSKLTEPILTKLGTKHPWV